MKTEWRVFLTSIMFFTRIPVPHIPNFSDDLLNRSIRYFPFIGILVGLIGLGAWWLFLLIFPSSLALLLSMATTILLTGAFHEDGFADFCDGYGGGLDRSKILTIMKDSRLGTYGTIGLIAMLSIKFTSLNSISLSLFPFALLTGHVLSRFMPVILVYTTNYARDDDTSKTKPLGSKASFLSLSVAFVFAILSLLWLHFHTILLLTGVLLILFILFRAYIIRKTGGFTGDVLGALQQLAEIIIYLTILAVELNETELFNSLFLALWN